MKIVSLDEAESFFPGEWMERIRQDAHFNKSHCCLLEGKESGCTVTPFDGMNILWNLWTPPPLRNNGHAQRLARGAAERFFPQVMFARYRVDEANVAQLFKKAGYEIVHTGTDRFVIVAFRNMIDNMMV